MIDAMLFVFGKRAAQMRLKKQAQSTKIPASDSIVSKKSNAKAPTVRVDIRKV